jgi:hypothetical protein
MKKFHMGDPQILDSRVQNCCLACLVPSQQFCILVWCMIKIIPDQNETHLTTGSVNIFVWNSSEAVRWFERLNVQMVNHMHINTGPFALQHFIYALSTNMHFYVALRWTFIHLCLVVQSFFLVMASCLDSHLYRILFLVLKFNGTGRTLLAKTPKH